MNLKPGIKTVPKPSKKAAYNLQPPTVKAEVADRLRAIERAAGPVDVVASRCCGRCRTPYNCGNKACPCHTIRYTS